MNSDRYVRQTNIDGLGDAGQERLSDASVLIIGAGGIGTTLMYDLVASGVGTVGIADHEIVKISNLNRQYIHFEKDVGTLKVLSAARKLKKQNSDVNVIPHATAINKDNAYEIISQYDIVALAVDNAQARMIVNEACVELNKPLVDGAVNGFVGTSVFVKPHETPCLACLYGTELPPEEHFNAVAPVTSAIGSICAATVIQYLLEGDSPLAGEMLYYNASEALFEKNHLEFNESCPVCGGNHNSDDDYEEED